MNIGQFVAAEIIILLVISSVEKLISGLESVYDVLTSLEKLGQVVDKDLEPQTGHTPFRTKEKFKIELDQVSFYDSRNDKMVLDNISMNITSDSSILIQGPNGAGKSTLQKLIGGLIEPTSGQIYINNRALQGVNLNEYRATIGQSLTGESPFEGTILENITFGDPDISQDDVYDTLEKVGLLSFVKEQVNGLDTIIYPEGKTLSYTVTKKIILARSIVTKPKLLLLKNPLDQFDPEEQSRIMKFLVDPSNPWALVVVSRSKGWDQLCNTFINMENGKLINAK